METHTISDSGLRLDRYRIIESQLMTIIEESVLYANSDITRLKNILYRIEMLVMESDDLVVDQCEGYEDCLKQRYENIFEELSFIFEPV